MEEQGKRRRRVRVVLVPWPFQGHINPMLQLGSILHSNGFSITVVHAQYNSPDPSSHPDFSFVPLPDTSSAPDFTGEIVASIVQLSTNYKACFQECLAQVMSQQGSDEGIACIIHDELMYFSEAVANALKLPSISLTASNAAHFLARSALVQLKAEGHIPFPESKSQNLVPEFYPLRFKDLPILEKLESYLALVSKAFNNKTSSPIIYNTIDFLENSSLEKIQHQWQVPIFTMGPMHRIASTSSSSLLEEDTSCLAWLDKQSCKSVIYVSLGSVAFMDIKELAEMAWGLANSHQPFLWVVRPGSVLGEELIEVLFKEFKENIDDRGYIVKWAPQKKVLAHVAVGGFLSHCGWNSTLESICEGIPMICRPCFMDQKVNARYISQVWRVGLELEGDLERGEIKRAVKKLMVGEEGEAMREKAKKLKENVELCIKEGGSSYNSMNRLVEMIRSF
ncbi:flavonol 3-O-glucosyltransferase UGT76E12-like [Corylus avellana]|uniref:flavonol 3-O-glucosyltransferase UGT76E12-like n=1 Tax=Corylus avellana TaxID=13451 RepID=UPI00286C3EBF|nr:flavonol 3-O-glucosyltransferase UGT76E12-like [Corylus avellana]